MKRQNTILVLITIILILMGQGCGKFINIQIMEHADNKIPSANAFKVYPSLDGTTNLHVYNSHPIKGEKIRLYATYKAPRSYELASLEYSLDGIKFHKFPIGMYNHSFRRGEHKFITITNRKDRRERTVFFRAYFKNINHDIDPITNRVRNISDNMVGPVMAKVTLYHSTR